MEIWFTFAELGIMAIVSYLILQRYCSTKVHLLFKLLIYIGLLLAFGAIILVPLDIYIVYPSLVKADILWGLRSHPTVTQPLNHMECYILDFLYTFLYIIPILYYIYKFLCIHSNAEGTVRPAVQSCHIRIRHHSICDFHNMATYEQ